MGAGIAQVFAQHGFRVILFDLSETVLQQALQGIEKNLSTAVEKGKLTAEAKSKATGLLSTTTDLNKVKVDLVVEAIIEKLEAKQQLFTQLASINSPQTIFASNTSSLSITQIAKGIPQPERLAGMHFFNPAHLMKLVEIVAGAETADTTTKTLVALTEQLDKTAVVCKDAPGFIVNRVARHYYVESLKMAEENAATIENIDALLESAGFKMGPFKLMDTIGNDINFAVTSSIFQAFHQEPRFRPSRLQQKKVDAGHLGKKTGRGFYKY